MNDAQDGLTRSEVLKRGLLGLTALTVLPTAAACRREQDSALITPEPAEKLDVGYREVEGFAPAFHTCRGLAVSGDDVWVAGDMAAAAFADRRLKQSFDVPGAAQALAADTDGTLYVALEDRMIVVSPKGLEKWEPLGPRARLVEAILSGEEVLVADAGNRCVVRYDKSGAVLGRIGERDQTSGYTGLIIPSPYLGLAALPSGEVAVCNPGQHRIEFHSRDGKLLRTIGENGQDISGFCGCCNPMSLAVLPTGDIVTAEKGIPRVKVLSSDGHLKKVVAPPSAFDPKTTGLEVAILGKRVLVLDPWMGSVRVFEPT